MENNFVSSSQCIQKLAFFLFSASKVFNSLVKIIWRLLTDWLGLGVPATMNLCSEKDVWHKSISKRQQIQQEHESLTRTAYQTAVELVSVKAGGFQSSFFKQSHHR